MKIAATLASALLALSFAAPDAARAQEPLQIAPRTIGGDSFRLKITRSREIRSGDKPATKAAAETQVAVRVAQVAAEGMLIEWTPGETRVVEPKGAAQDPLTDLAAGIRFELELEPTGVLRGLRNHEEVRGKLVARVEQATAGRDDGERQRIRQAIEPMLASREAIEQAMLEDLGLYLMAFGRSYTPGKPERFRSAVATPISEKPVPASGTVKLASLDEKTGSAKIEIRQQLDAKAAAAAVRAWVTESARRRGEEAPKADQLGALEIADRADFTIPVAEGWPSAVRYQRKLTTPGGSETKVKTIRREP